MTTTHKALQKFFAPRDHEYIPRFFRQLQRMLEKRPVSATTQSVAELSRRSKNLYTDPASLSTRTLLSSKRLQVVKSEW